MTAIRKRDNGKWRGRSCDARGADAQRWLDEVTTDLMAGRHVDPRACRTAFETSANGWPAPQATVVATSADLDIALEDQALENQVRVPTVHRWIEEARRRGFLAAARRGWAG